MSDIPELHDLDSDHRHRVIDAAIRQSFWSLPSLTVAAVLTGAGAIATVTMVDGGFWSGFVPPLVTFGGSFLYRLIAINSFLRPTVRSLRDSELPSTVKNQANPIDFYAAMGFVLAVFLGLFIATYG